MQCKLVYQSRNGWLNLNGNRSVHRLHRSHRGGISHNAKIKNKGVTVREIMWKNSVVSLQAGLKRNRLLLAKRTLRIKTCKKFVLNCHVNNSAQWGTPFNVYPALPPYLPGRFTVRIFQKRAGADTALEGNQQRHGQVSHVGCQALGDCV
ncbi:hypothetical protein J6590_060512 [Homalodisca vitripennis]|nr:hypothetical protein J6590_060512 [Homalodisca vitripennis]